MVSVFVILLSAHSFGDFLLQTDAMAKNKAKPWILVAHSLLHGALVYGLLQQWSAWQVPVAVVVLHGVIDFFKSRREATSTTFIWDQAAHVVSLAIVAPIAVNLGWCTPFVGHGWMWIVGLAGFVAVVQGAGFFVGAIAKKLVATNPDLEKTIAAGLKEGGEQIGRLERALIFAFILVGEPTGIGFLVTAKSILRFEEAKQQPVAEYVLIGTLWSFGLAMALSWLTQRALTLGVAP
jgi:hypothetical protein